MKALAGHSLQLLTTYKLLISSVLHYSAPVWYPNTSPTVIRSLQTIQNSALRISTGALQMSYIDHLHVEAAVLPLNDNLSLRCRQYLASAMRSEHPSHLSLIHI